MKGLLALIRILIFLGLTALAVEYFFGTEEYSAISKYKEVSIFLAFLAIVLVIVEMVLYRINKTTDSLLTPEQRLLQASQKNEDSWFSRVYTKLLDQKPIEKESEIILDHEYDGIQELDNNLPPWWVYLFVACVVFAGIYLVNFHFLGADNQANEYLNDEKRAQELIAAYKKANPHLIDVDNVTLLTEASDLQAGKDVFMANCIACHAPDGGGGIGPNLTDNHWILGGGIKNVFNTVTNGGRQGKGMVPWKGTISPKQIQQVSSYIISLKGSTPMNPKAPEGDVWTE